MTAVEWLFEQLDVVDSSISYELFKQAKEMEKQQIIDAWNDVYGHIKDAEQYYNETYGSKESETKQ